MHQNKALKGNLNTVVLFFNTLSPSQNGHHFPDDLFKCIFLIEKIGISIKILLKLVPKCPINNMPTLVQIMAWHQSDNKPLSEPMMVSLLTHVCVTQPQWVKKKMSYNGSKSMNGEGYINLISQWKIYQLKIQLNHMYRFSTLLCFGENNKNSLPKYHMVTSMALAQSYHKISRAPLKQPWRNFIFMLHESLKKW